MIIPILLLGFFLLLIGVFLALYWSFRRNKNYWITRNVVCKEPRFLAGNFAEVGKKNLGIIFRELYEEAKSEKVYGIWQFNVPVLLVIDLALVKRILVTDFLHFDDHGVYFDEKTDPLAANLLTLGGSKWRSLRTKLNPAFTAGRLKAMFPLILGCGKELAHILKPSAEKQDVVEFKDLFARFTTDVISSCAFGIETNSLINENAVFRIMGKKVFQSSWEVIFRNFIGFLFPNFARFFKIRIYPKQLTDFFIGVIREAMNFRESKNIKRNDILQRLIQLKNESLILETDLINNRTDTFYRQNEGKKFSYEEAAAQAFIFFTAGFETSSTTMQYALFELAMNPNIQDRVRTEIQQISLKNGGSLTYDAVQQMTYLGRVIDETLRKYPPVTNLSRMCTKEYKIPGTDITLNKGTQLSVSVLGLHWDDRYYPNPEKFDPDRFIEDQKLTRPPYTYMPFGEGPRTCIGRDQNPDSPSLFPKQPRVPPLHNLIYFRPGIWVTLGTPDAHDPSNPNSWNPPSTGQRFGLIQAKIGLILILLNYKVSIAKSESRIPPVYDPKSFFSAPKGGMNLKISLL